MRKGKKSRWACAALLFALLLGGALHLSGKNFHPYVVFQTAESIQVVLIQGTQPTRRQCDAVVDRVVDTMRAQCSDCRLQVKRCLDQLDARQRKLLSGMPVDVPMLRLPGSNLAFLSNLPDMALEICQGAGRHAARSMPAECAKPGADGIALSVAKIGGAKHAAGLPGYSTLLNILLIAATISLLVCFLIIRSGRLHGRFSHDLAATGRQKFHTAPTPRIGGIAIAAALAGSVLALEALNWLRLESAHGLTMLALSAIPAFAGGLGEDLTKKVGVPLRLLLTFAAALLASLFVGATLDRLDMPGLDTLLLLPVFAIAFTAFAVGGIANSINIIDGYNGLAGSYSVLVLAAFAGVAAQAGDPVVLAASLAMLGALLGFLVFNYPGGRIFLGDGGAYLLGFWLGELSVLLVVRNPEVSPWLPIVLLVYPVVETLFSIYRRKILKGRSAGRADAMHLHQLIYSRLARVVVARGNGDDKLHRNNTVVLYIVAGSALFMIPALLVWNSTPWLVTLGIAYWIAYLWLYFRLARWRAPTWLVLSPKKQVIRGY